MAQRSIQSARPALEKVKFDFAVEEKPDYVPGMTGPPVPEPTILPVHDSENIIVDRIEFAPKHERETIYIVSEPGKERTLRVSVLERNLSNWVSDRTREEFEEKRYRELLREKYLKERLKEEPNPNQKDARAGKKNVGPVVPKTGPAKKRSWSRKKGARDPNAKKNQGRELTPEVAAVPVTSPSTSRAGRDLLQGAASDKEEEVNPDESMGEDTQTEIDRQFAQGLQEEDSTVATIEIAPDMQTTGFGKNTRPGKPQRHPLSQQISISPSPSIESEPTPRFKSRGRSSQPTAMLPPPPASRKRGSASISASPEPTSTRKQQRFYPTSKLPPPPSAPSPKSAPGRIEAPKAFSLRRETTSISTSASPEPISSRKQQPYLPTSKLPLPPSGLSPKSAPGRRETRSASSSRPGTSDSANPKPSPGIGRPPKRRRRGSVAGSSAVEAGALYQRLSKEETKNKSMKNQSFRERFSSLPKSKHANKQPESTSSSSEEDDSEDEYLVRTLLADEWRHDSAGNPQRWFHVQWEGDWPASWEPEENIGEAAKAEFEHDRSKEKADYPGAKKKGKGATAVDAGKGRGKVGDVGDLDVENDSSRDEEEEDEDEDEDELARDDLLSDRPSSRESRSGKGKRVSFAPLEG